MGAQTTIRWVAAGRGACGPASAPGSGQDGLHGQGQLAALAFARCGLPMTSPDTSGFESLPPLPALVCLYTNCRSNSLHIFIAIVSHKGLAAYALGSSIVDSEARCVLCYAVPCCAGLRCAGLAAHTHASCGPMRCRTSQSAPASLPTAPRLRASPRRPPCAACAASGASSCPSPLPPPPVRGGQSCCGGGRPRASLRP